MTGDGKGHDWVHAYGLLDESLANLMGSQIPNEPSYLIMNTAISSTWGFPYDTPDWCPKCYDCNDPKCACAFYPGFCEQLRRREVNMYIDNIRIYQSRNASAHVGAEHTIGCDPPDYPTKEWIEGHEYRYMRNPPFSYEDKGPLRKIKRGGGSCDDDSDCGGDLQGVNYTAMYEAQKKDKRVDESDADLTTGPRGRCVMMSRTSALFGQESSTGKVCACNDGFTGPHCLALEFIDDTPSAKKINNGRSPFERISKLAAPTFLMFFALGMLLVFLFSLRCLVTGEHRLILAQKEMMHLKSDYSRQNSGPYQNQKNDLNSSLATGFSI